MKYLSCKPLFFILILLGGLVSLSCQGNEMASHEDTVMLITQASQALIKRTLPNYADRFKVEYTSADSGRDVFELETEDDQVVLRGNNGVSVASAFNYWLKQYAHCQITWNGSNLRIPSPFPLVPGKIRKVTPYRYRYYFNYCTFNYTMSWWDWKRWGWEIDFMAMNGINMPLALTGQNIIWDKVYRSMGFTDKEMDAFFSGPAYFNWFWMGNLDGWGGPLPKSWMRSHEILGKKILQRERALGMTPILPSFTGHVPPSFTSRFPNVKVDSVQWGVNFKPALVLDPRTPMFATIGKKFLQELINTYGTDHFYSADVFNEMIPPSNDSSYLNEMSKKIYESMSFVDKKATWILQGWMFLDKPGFWEQKQMRDFFSGVPRNDMMVLDLDAEARPVWKRTDAFYGEKWIWCMLHNFGGRRGLYGDMQRIAHDPAETLYDKGSGNLAGIGLTMEAIEQNPALYSLMFENIWRSEPIDLDRWLHGYVMRRYGKEDDHAWHAWKILENSVYKFQPWEGISSIITGRPTLENQTVWTPTEIPYSPLALVEAWKQLLEASGNLKYSDGFQYDVVDITRQVLANYADILQQSFSNDYRNHDLEAFKSKSAEFLGLIDDLDKILATRQDFLLGRWLHDAKGWGSNMEEKRLYEGNARDLITLWGNKDCGIHEYASRQWAGLLVGFYKPRWEQYIAYVIRRMQQHKKIDQEAFEERIKNWEWGWVNGHEDYPDKTQGDPLEVAQALFTKYYLTIKQSYPNI